MFKKPLIFVCMTVIVFLLICGCAAKQEASLPQLIIGCNNYEPYYYADADGEPAGMDVDLAKEACARMGYVPVFRQINWNERDAALESGEVDCLWSCLTMDVLPDDYAWVGPYMRSRQVVAVLEDSPIHTLSDLTGKRVAVRTGSKAEKLFLKTFPRWEKFIPKIKRMRLQLHCVTAMWMRLQAMLQQCGRYFKRKMCNTVSLMRS